MINRLFAISLAAFAISFCALIYFCDNKNADIYFTIASVSLGMMSSIKLHRGDFD